MRLCFENEGIREIVGKVRGIISSILRNSHALESLTVQESSAEVIIFIYCYIISFLLGSSIKKMSIYR